VVHGLAVGSVRRKMDGDGSVASGNTRQDKMKVELSRSSHGVWGADAPIL